MKYRDYIHDAYTKALKAGIRYALGTDGQHGEMAYELEKLVEFGVSPVDALKAATASASELCAVEDKVGTLESDKFADMVVIDGDPTLDISHIRKVKAVYKGGVKLNPNMEW